MEPEDIPQEAEGAIEILSVEYNTLGEELAQHKRISSIGTVPARFSSTISG